MAAAKLLHKAGQKVHNTLYCCGCSKLADMRSFHPMAFLFVLETNY